MTMFATMSAGLLAVAAMLPGPVGAQTRYSEARTVHVTRTEVDRTDNGHRDNNWNHGHHYGRDKHQTRRVCKNVRRNGHRQRVCRTFRR